MATKKTTGAKAPKATEKQVEQAVPATENRGTQYRIPFISAKIDRMSTDPNSKIKANARERLCHVLPRKDAPPRYSTVQRYSICGSFVDGSCRER